VSEVPQVLQATQAMQVPKLEALPEAPKGVHCLGHLSAPEHPQAHEMVFLMRQPIRGRINVAWEQAKISRPRQNPLLLTQEWGY
jgi:hypothetical protein